MALLFTFMFFLVLYFPCDAEISRWVISEQEDSELERQLKILNKSPVKTIQMQDGDVFDCIEIYKQPALDHPSLKNHKIQIRPISVPEGMPNDIPNHGDHEACPVGTVLIPRTDQRRDLIRDKHHEGSIMRRYSPNSHTYNSTPSEEHWALLATKLIPHYYGAKASMTIYGFPNLKSHQGSGGVIGILGDGPPERFNVLQAGWHASTNVYSDTRTRLFTYWTVDGYNNTGCNNLQCPGFVQVSNTFSPGYELSPVSVYNGIQYSITLLIFKDQKTGHWWLYLEHGDFKDFIGYWPKEILNNLDFANQVKWAGYASSDLDQPSPPMGSGHFPSEGPNKTCYFKQIEIVDEKNTLRQLPENYVVSDVSDLPKYYDISDYHDGGGTDRYMFAYGGPGGYQI